MKSLFFLASLMVALPITGWTQGTIGLAPDIGRAGRLFLRIDPLQAGRFIPVTGDGYSAQLWYQIGQGDWKPAGAPATFTDTGEIRRRDATIKIEGTLGGDLVNLFVRAWDNHDGNYDTWAKASSATECVLYGDTRVITGYQLGGADADNNPILMRNIAWESMASVRLTACIPEPSILVLGALGLGTLFLPRSQRNRQD